jgi:hypothetical protein
MTQTDTGTIETASYTVTDKFFGAPYVDRDEEIDDPLPHRRIHGGFENTDTRFTFYFPAATGWEGRMFQPLEGAHAGHEDAFGGAMGMLLGGLEMITRLGGFMVESNSGHVGDTMDARGGPDPTLYGFRASAETARFAKHVAAQVYGRRPETSIVWGGSGGGRRSPLCLEYGPDAWDGALPFMGGGDVDKHGTTERVRGAQTMAFAAMFNVQRLLGQKLVKLVDALSPGGIGDPYEGLTAHEREELTNLFRLGYPRGDEFMILSPMGQIWLWTAAADDFMAQDPEYFDAFWTKPGYVGHDSPEHVANDVIDVVTTVTRTISPRDFLEHPDFSGPEFARMRQSASMMLAGSGGLDVPFAVQIEGLGDGYRLGAGVRIMNGAAAGRQLYCMSHTGDVLFCDGEGSASIERFTGVLAGDEVHVDNRPFLAFCYYYRHHLMPDAEFDFLRIDGRPIYPNHDVPLASPLMGTPYSGQYEGKLLWIHHTHDSSLWPAQGLVYGNAVEQAQGAEAKAEKFALRWTENAEHVPGEMFPSPPGRAATTWLIDYRPHIEQGLTDLVRWIEDGVKPAETNFDYHDGAVTLPSTASGRGGIQPVVAVTADGGVRADVKAGATVTLEVVTEVPRDAGTIISVEWDFDGTGTFPFHHDVTGSDTALTLSTTHTYEKAGTYYATARVCSHRNGDVNATTCRIPNVASARVVVT